jgi:hypothetical protein
MRCRRCHKAKKPADFYANDNSCKECRRSLVRANRLANSEYYKAYDRERGQHPNRKLGVKRRYHERYAGTQSLRDTNERWLTKNKEKRAANIIVGNAIRDGKLIPKPCARCGKKKTHAHHEDYTKPFKVTWLCTKHHGERHREINEERRNAKSSRVSSNQERDNQLSGKP